MTAILPALLFVIFVACVAWLYTDGMWGNAVRLVNVVTAGLLAMTFFEPAAEFMEGWLPSFTFTLDFLALWGTFALTLVVFRLITDRVSRVKVRFMKIVDRIGSGILAACVGWVLVCFTLYIIIPTLFQTLDRARYDSRLLLETRPRVTVITTSALTEDVAAGRAEYVGQDIRKTHLSEPAGVFYDKVVRSDPSDPDSAKVGQGRFNAEIWFLSWFGVDFTGCSKAQLVATRFFVDALLPFVLLFLFSVITPPVDRQHLDAFYGKLHTPVQPSAAEEQRALAQAVESPRLHETKKLWPGSNWEILKPGWIDVLGFGGSCLLVGMVIALLYLLVKIGA